MSLYALQISSVIFVRLSPLSFSIYGHVTAIHIYSSPVVLLGRCLSQGCYQVPVPGYNHPTCSGAAFSTVIVTTDIHLPPCNTTLGSIVSIVPVSNFQASLASSVTVPAMPAHEAYGVSTGLALVHATILSTTATSGLPVYPVMSLTLGQLTAAPHAYPVVQTMYAQPAVPYLDNY